MEYIDSLFQDALYIILNTYINPDILVWMKLDNYKIIHNAKPCTESTREHQLCKARKQNKTPSPYLQQYCGVLAFLRLTEYSTKPIEIEKSDGMKC